MSKGVYAGNSNVPLSALHQGTDQKIAYAGTSVQSAAFGAGVTVVRLLATTDCHVKFGANPTAAATTALLKANQPELFGAVAGEKVAVIQDASGGDLYVTEGAV